MANAELKHTPDDSDGMGGGSGRHVEIVLANNVIGAAVGGIYPENDGVFDEDYEEEESGDEDTEKEEDADEYEEDYDGEDTRL
jgi:hypothetical protein